MRVGLICACAGLICLLLAPAALAESVTFEWVFEVDSIVEDDYGGLATGPSLPMAVGDDIVLTTTWDTDQAPVPSPNSLVGTAQLTMGGLDWPIDHDPILNVHFETSSTPTPGAFHAIGMWYKPAGLFHDPVGPIPLTMEYFHATLMDYDAVAFNSHPPSKIAEISEFDETKFWTRFRRTDPSLPWGGSEFAMQEVWGHAISVTRVAPIPEPSTLALVGLGVGFFAWTVRRRKKAA